jgi:single-strand DNA-binding protein
MNNQLTLIGRAGQNPKAVSFGDTGNKVAKFSLGVKEFSNKDEESTMWIDVDAWNGLGERVMQYITKGREVVLTGRLVINHYNKEVDGVKVEVQKPVLNLSSFHLCGPKPQAEEASAEETATDINSSKPRRSRKAS